MSKTIIQIYAIIFVVIFVSFFVVGIMSGLVIIPDSILMPIPEATRLKIYFFAGKITGIFSPMMFGVIIILNKIGKIKINENLIYSKGEENEEN